LKTQEVFSPEASVIKGWATWLAHTNNPSYAGGRDQKDLSLRLAQANS
jgi:hypothetical protein